MTMRLPAVACGFAVAVHLAGMAARIAALGTLLALLLR